MYAKPMYLLVTDLETGMIRLVYEHIFMQAMYYPSWGLSLIHFEQDKCMPQSLGMQSKVIQERPVPSSKPATSAASAKLSPVPTGRARLQPQRPLVEVSGSQGSWDAELSESERAQLQRSQSRVAVVQRSADFDEDMFEVREAPASAAAAVWEDIVEVKRLPCTSCKLHCRQYENAGPPLSAMTAWSSGPMRHIQRQVCDLTDLILNQLSTFLSHAGHPVDQYPVHALVQQDSMEA